MIGALNSLSLRTKLIVAFVLLVICTIAVLDTVVGTVTRGKLTRTAADNLHGHATTQAQLVASSVARQIDTLQAFALSAVVQDYVATVNDGAGDRAVAMEAAAALESRWGAAADSDPLVVGVLDNPAASELVEYVGSHPDTIELLVTDAAGGLVAASRRPDQYFYAEAEWWAAIMRAGSVSAYIAPPVLDQRAGLHVLEIAIPLYGHGEREVVGVLRARYRLGAIEEQLHATRFGSSGHAELLLGESANLSEAGVPAALSDAEQATVADAIARPTEPHRLRDTLRYLSVVPVEGDPAVRRLGWRILTYQDAAEVLAPIEESLRVNLLIGLGVIALATIPATVIAQVISAPINAAARAARRIADGDLAHRLPNHRRDELGALAESFNSMAGALERRIASEQAAQAERLRLQDAIITAQEATLRELSTPLIPLADDVLLLPLIGSVDSRRAQQILQDLLHGVARARARTVILDLTGVAIIDTHVGQVLLQATRGVQMLGAEVVLAGIRAEVAQTIVSLAIDFSDQRIYGSLQDAITDLLGRRAVA